MDPERHGHAAPMTRRDDPLIEVSVVVPVLNEAPVLGHQIESLLPQLGADAEIVIVDNGSTDATPDVIAAYVEAHDRIRMVHAPNMGVNRARNAGVEAARGRFILLCDADDQVLPGWVDALRDGLQHADLVGGVVIAVDHANGMTETVDPSDEYLWTLASPWGCCCGFRRDTWERVGGFDPRMSGAFDETDFFLRAQLAGAHLAWTSAAVRYAADWSPRKARRWARERDRFSCRAYWMGRMMGRPRTNRLERDLISLVVRAPAVAFSRRLRTLWCAAAVRRWDRLAGLCRFGLPEISKAVRATDSLCPKDHQGDVVETRGVGYPVEQ